MRASSAALLEQAAAHGSGQDGGSSVHYRSAIETSRWAHHSLAPDVVGLSVPSRPSPPAHSPHGPNHATGHSESCGT